MSFREMDKDKKRLIIMGGIIIVSVILLIIIIASAINNGQKSKNLDDKQSKPDEIFLPSNMMYIDDLYQGRTVIPKYDIEVSKLDLDKFVKTKDRITYADAAVGIDVSEHQKTIDWEKVKASGINYAIIRVGYRGYTKGGLFTDKYFLQNMDAAIKAGLDIGVYFFSQALNNQEAEEEARFVLGQLEDYKEHIKYPVFFDWEFVTDEKSAPRTEKSSPEKISSSALAFCEKIKSAGYRSGYYTNKYMGYKTFDLELLKDHDLWYAEYQDKPSFYYHYDIWQYSESVTVPGIDVAVDINLSFKKY